jgi:hypothetical protein
MYGTEQVDPPPRFLHASDTFALDFTASEHTSSLDPETGSGSQLLDQKSARLNGIVLSQYPHEYRICTGTGCRVIQAGCQCIPDRNGKEIRPDEFSQHGTKHGFPFLSVGCDFISVLEEGKQVCQFVEQGDQK